MRSTFSGLNTMVLGIYANQVSQETVGHNITNANTEGYSRQSVNLAAIRANQQTSLYGNVLVGAGVDSMSLTRARDIFADRQFWTEKSTSVYLDTRHVQYQKIESIFDDTNDNDIEKTLENFYSAWETLSVDASLSSPRINVIGKAKTYADYIHTAAQKLQEQINVNYADMSLNVTKMNNITKQITQLNKAITSAEATGAMANDLRDQRDLLTDELSTYTNINVYENDLGMYQIVSNGITLVDGIHSLTLQMSEPLYNKVYGVSDFVIQIKETTGLTFVPQNGAMKALADAIAEDKEYIDVLADMSAFMLTKLNDVHKQGVGIDSDETGGLNFFGDYNTNYTWEERNDATPKGINGFYVKAERYEEHWTTNPPTRTDGVATFEYVGEPETTDYLQGIALIKELEVCPIFSQPDGEKLVAARKWGQVQIEDDTYGTSLQEGIQDKKVGQNVQSALVGGKVWCAANDFEATVSVNASGELVYICTGVGGNEGDVYTLQWVEDGGFAGSAYYFFDQDGNKVNHAMMNLADASGKLYNIGYLDEKIYVRSLEDGTQYELNTDDTYDEYGNPLMYVLFNVPTEPAETGKPVYDAVYEVNGTGDGSNAVELAALFNLNDDMRLITDPIGTLSVNNFYNKKMTKLGSDSEATNMKIEAQEEVLLQIEEWRQSTSGVNWNEELTNMLKFQQGFSACGRCLTTMDEMLDRLINSTGMVGR